ncbi:hypothetical protein KN248_012980 [Mycobacterium paraintracellulare]|uniref:hypothetical protein n=1 Tax=Mycobacterium paraintracellulare TaxID=1138383 RepID=UPI001EEEC7B6|nr:hypothetical protein [Mycobacterium paraintracellulare]WVL46267.1 hypothetical protein KN248_012980 [Mycobacterium paraintracellulare]
MSLGFVIACMLIFGAIAAAVGQRKNLPVGQSFALGALLGLIGLVVVICQKPGLPQAPQGMRAVKCRRCNTVQNVPENQRIYECWQCKAANELWAAPPVSSGKPQVVKPPIQTAKVRCHKCQHVQTVPVDQATFMCEECRTRLKRKPLTSNPTGEGKA